MSSFVILLFVLAVHETQSQLKRDMIPFKFFYPPGRICIRREMKIQLPVGQLDVGSPAHQLRESLELIPPGRRIEILNQFITGFPDITKFDPTESAYASQVYKSSTIDPGVYRLLARYATSFLDPETEGHLTSASAIVEYIQSKFPDGQFDFITPEYILDWYEALGGSYHRIRCTTDPTIRSKIERNVRTIYGDPEMGLDLRGRPWRDILKLRRDRLAKSGYEYAI